MIPPEDSKGAPIMLKAILIADDLKANPDVLVRIKETSSKIKHNYSPTLVVGTNKVSKAQKLQLAFIGHVLSKLQKHKPVSGIIVAGRNKNRKIKLEPLYKEIKLILTDLRAWTQDSRSESPPVILNKNCPYCRFQKECETKAIKRDHLSLLRGMSPKKIEQQNKNGIFTVDQFSYTYRPRKKKKNRGKYVPKYYYSLKALAIRDKKIYVVKKPKVPSSATQIYLDVEGDPDQNFYYLIGIVVVEEFSEKTFSFWADKQEDEKIIYKEFLTVVGKYSEFTLFHYGSYETHFINRMIKKYGRIEEELLRQIQSNSINTLSLIYGNIYFPTYSNSLKDIGNYLGQNWSEKSATGLKSLVWRYRWDITYNQSFKDKLITYNMEDCFALKKTTETIVNISNDYRATVSDIVSVDDINVESTYKFGPNQFLFQELDFINKCAYFDYQREKIFFRKKIVKYQN